MNIIEAFWRRESNRHKESMVFDWEKAARIIKERKPKKAAAGLRGDFENTGGVIFEEGEIVPSDEVYTFLGSKWAEPGLYLYLDDESGYEVIPCYVMQTEKPDYNPMTYWPKEAIDILNE